MATKLFHTLLVLTIVVGLLYTSTIVLADTTEHEQQGTPKQIQGQQPLPSQTLIAVYHPPQAPIDRCNLP